MTFTLEINAIMLTKLLVSVLIGLSIGRERKKHEKSGGSRTMAIMCLSACVLAVMSQELVKIYDFDFARLMQGALQGISFIGMGLIWKNKDGVEGLTTASTLFGVVILGFLIGLDFWLLGISTAVLILLILESKYWKIK